MSFVELEDAMELAWGIIANASDWDREDCAEWRAAAERWRDGPWAKLCAAKAKERAMGERRHASPMSEHTDPTLAEYAQERREHIDGLLSEVRDDLHEVCDNIDRQCARIAELEAENKRLWYAIERVRDQVRSKYFGATMQYVREALDEIVKAKEASDG